MSNTQGSDLKSTDFGYVLDLFRNTPPSKLVDSAKNRFPLLSKLTSGKYARSLGAATAAFLLVRIFYQRVSVATGSAYAAELKRAQQFKEVLVTESTYYFLNFKLTNEQILTHSSPCHCLIL